MLFDKDEGKRNMTNDLMDFKIDPIILTALEEDITDVDISTKILGANETLAKVDLLAKQDGVLSGMAVFERVFTLLNAKVKVEWLKTDGQSFDEGEILAKVHGDVETLLTAERVALNFLQRMSGIATATRRMADQLEGSQIKLMDTRKTTPGLRMLEKYSVRVGGGNNHRYNLSDMIMLKDNHINAAGGVQEAIKLAKERSPFIKKVEVETENLEMVKDAISAGADIIMLDNMTVDEMREAIEFIDGRAIVEASGNLTAANIQKLKTLRIDYVSSGAITHSAGIVDLSMKNLTITNRVEML